MEAIVNDTSLLYIDNELYKINNDGSLMLLRGSISGGYRKICINYKIYYYHRIIYKCYNPDWDMTHNSNNHIDHIDQNKLNNNINNLRVVTIQQNAQNSKAKGYYLNKQTKKWKAQIRVNYKLKYLGSYHTEEEAHNAYLEGRKKYNFISNNI